MLRQIINFIAKTNKYYLFSIKVCCCLLLFVFLSTLITTLIYYELISLFMFAEFAILI
jgi:hypothetical protein